MSNKVFEFVNSINGNKENLFKTKGYTDSDYAPYFVNRHFSYFSDTIMIANEANTTLNNVPSESHFEFYANMITPKRRYSKWYKGESDDKIKLLCEIYNISVQKALEVADLFSKEDVTNMQQGLNCGGKLKQSIRDTIEK